MAKGKAIYINVPAEVAEMWKFQAFLERRTLKEIIMEAMDEYITKKLKEHGFDLAEGGMEEEEIALENISPEGWKMLEEAGVDVEALKAQLEGVEGEVS